MDNECAANILQAWFVKGFNDNNLLTPTSILVLFIVSVLACAWALATAIRLNSTRRSALFVAFIDICFVGAFIAAVYELRGIDNASCSNFRESRIYVGIGPFGYYGEQAGSKYARDIGKNCRMLKAAWAFGIMNIIMFVITSLLAIFLHKNEKTVVVKEVRRSRHSSRRGHSRSGSSRRSGSGRRSYYV
jgi:hypothetical protein